MKRFLFAAALVGVFSFVGLSMANAHRNHGFGSGKGHGDCDGYGSCSSRFYDDAGKEKVNSFLEEAKETRKQIAVKKSERRALMNQDNPDEKRVARLTGEIYDLKNLLDEKAKEVFVEYPPFGHKRARGSFGNCDRGYRNL